jgi:histone deacetylase 1/2
MGPFPIRGLKGEYHVLVLVDEFSNFGAAVPITSKSQSPFIVQRLILQWTSVLTGLVFRFLRSDRAKEFMVVWFEEWLVSMGGQHEFSCSYSPQQNGTAERYNGTIQNIARSLLLESKLANTFWPYAFSCASYLRNMLPTSEGPTPHTLFFGVKPNVSLLRVFGSTCYVTLVNAKKRS